MRLAAQRLRALLGRRGAFLLIIGTGKVCFGLGLILAPPSVLGLELLLRWAPLHCWASIWILAGAVTAVSAFLRVGRDWFGYVAGLAPPVVWGVAYGTAAVTGDFPRGAWVAGWFLFSHVGVILWAATVPEYELPPGAARKAR
jgi:hypothetical protein